ncbi:MAG: TlpA family protein disulfide reductase [Gemmataceae bacterium]|nr:TlpA family protein disulfide reductase [Gemmataceae bacterium]MBJ7345966.1 TlpA family protein disulfide reductase [Gemmataceae bacterium]MBJ7431540.1 TlpA family protein disulfide reductase [Gemmataceae bacterium]
MKIRFAFLVLFGMVLPLFAQDTTGKKPQTKPATPIKTADSDVEKSEGQKKLDSLRNEFKKLQDDVIQEYKDAKSPEEAQKLIPKIQQNLLKLPREDFAKKALALSKTLKSSDQGSFDSLVFAMSMVARGSNKEIMKEAVDLIVKDHSKNPKMASVLGFISTSPDGAAILEKIATKTEDRNIAGLAWYAITENLQQQTGEVGIKQAEELNKRTEMIYEKLAKDYADVAMANGRGTIGSTIKAALFELQNLSIGKVAPEVLCLNIDGDKDDKLSNYKGKVVVLDIWATWCGPCKAMIPHEREMNEKLKGKPFAFISISGDDKKETLTAFLEKEKMPWTHWFADRKGILKDWNIRFYPTMYILDHKGVIRAKGLRGEELEKKVIELIAEAEKSNKS